MKYDIKNKLGQKVDRHLGWGIMGSILIIILTLGIVGACAAVENKDGITAAIVIGAIALFVLLAYVAVYYIKKSKSVRPEEIAVEPEDEKAEAEEAEVAEEEAVAEEVNAEVVEEVAAEEVVESPVEVEAEAEAEVAEEEAAAEEEPVEAAEEEAVAEEEKVEEEEAVAEEESEEAAPAEEEEEPVVVITVEEARNTMGDEEALALIDIQSKKRVDGPMCTINVGILSATFEKGEVVTLDALQAKGLVPRKQNGYIVLAEGTINKALTVVANDFSADAVKMIVAAGGKAVGC